MTFPKPELGLVIRYSYLWRREADQGREEGAKDRPCAIIAAVTQEAKGPYRVAVVPITHSPPQDPRAAIEIPPKIGQALGLDWARSWLVTGEVNIFTWPGPDIRLLTHGRLSFGRLPQRLMEQARQQVFDQSRGRVQSVERDEGAAQKNKALPSKEGDAKSTPHEAKPLQKPSKDRERER